MCTRTTHVLHDNAPFGPLGVVSTAAANRSLLLPKAGSLRLLNDFHRLHYSGHPTVVDAGLIVP